MGHLINPISFRLGYSRNWGFSGALMESKSQYFYLNSKYYNLLLFFKRIFALQTFEKMGVLFSHLRFVNSFNSDIVIVYLYDGPFQNDSFIFYKYLNRLRKLKKVLKYCRKFLKRFMKRTFVLFYYFRTLELVYNKINDFLENMINFKVIKLMYLIAQLKSNFKILDNIYFLKSFFFKNKNFSKFFIVNLFLKKLNNFFYSCFVFDYIANLFFKLKNKLFNNNKYLMFLSLVKSVDVLLLNYKLYNLNFFVKIYNSFFRLNIFYIKFNYEFEYIINTRQSLKFLKNISNELLEEYEKINELVVFYNINSDLVIIIKFLFISFIEIFSTQRLKFYEFCQKFLFLIKQARKKKFIFLNFFFKFLVFFSSNLFIFLKNIVSLFKPFFINSISSNFLIYFKNVSKKEITASLISKYICIRLRQKFALKEIIRPILKDLTNNSVIKGFRLSCCGRFTKKEIATYRWERRGKASLNTVTACIDYSFNYVILKYSVCGIKIWLHKNSDYKYFFKKWFENFKFFYKRKKKKFLSRKKLKYNKIQKLKQKKTKFLKKKKITKIKEIHKLLQQKNNKQIDVIKMIYSKITNKAFKNAIKPFLRK